MPLRRLTVRQLQLRKARYSARFLRTQAARKPRKPIVTKAEFLKALPGSGGIRNELARRLKINRFTVRMLLERPDWQDMLQAVFEEEETMVDEAQSALQYAIAQRLDIGVSSMNARWLLSKVRKQTYGEETKTVIEGGKNPVRVNTANLTIPIEALTLPIEVRRVVLEAADKMEADTKAAAMATSATRPVPALPVPTPIP